MTSSKQTMSKKNDDSIERIFRQVLTQYDDASSTIKNDWTKMEQMLVEAERQRAAIRSKRNKGIAFSVAAVIGLLTAVYFLSFNNQAPTIAENEAAPNETQVSAGADSSRVGSIGQNADSLISPDMTVDDNKHQSGELQKSLDTEALPANGEVAKAGNERAIQGSEKPSGQITSPSPQRIDGTQDKGSNRANNNRRELATIIAPADSEHLRVNGGDEIPGEAVGVESQGIVSNSDNGEDGRTSARKSRDLVAPSDDAKGEMTIMDDKGLPSKESDSSSTGNGPSHGKSEAISNADSLSVDKTFVAKTDSTITGERAEDISKRSLLPFHRLSVSLLFAPEFSATSMSGYSRPGESYGLRVGYQITRRFGVATGVIRSRKKYTGSGYDYKPVNPAYWEYRTNGVIPEEIDGRCLIYELPLSFRYDVIQSSKSNVFATAGISSFFMASQLYEYSFEQPNPGADTDWSTSKMENYWFSSVMISAGYERNIGNSWAIGIEPYLKMTLSEIGWPNVKLFSTGGYITLRYKFMMKQ